MKPWIIEVLIVGIIAGSVAAIVDIRTGSAVLAWASMLLTIGLFRWYFKWGYRPKE